MEKSRPYESRPNGSRPSPLRSAEPRPAPAAYLSPRAKLLLSLVLVLHLAAVVLGPLAMPPHGSELARSVASLIEPYLQAANLGNGYRFFAPEPGPGHLVRYEVLLPDGRQVDGIFPDLKTERPRLLYHRYFMLSEFLNSLERPGAEELATRYEKSYVGHLIHQYDPQSVKLYLRLHQLPTMKQVSEGMSLDDRSLYDEKLLVEWTDHDD